MSCVSDQVISEESIALKVIEEFDSRLKSLYRTNKSLTPLLYRTKWSYHIQPHFDYVPSIWYPSITQKVRNRIRIMQNKRVQYCLQQDIMPHITNVWITWVQMNVKQLYLVLIVSCYQTQNLPPRYNDQCKVYSLMVSLMIWSNSTLSLKEVCSHVFWRITGEIAFFLEI